MDRARNFMQKAADYWSYKKKNWGAFLLSGYYKRKYARIMDQQEIKIVKTWKESWENHEVLINNTSENTAATIEELNFSDWVVGEFYFLDSGAKYNKNKNFIMKFLSLLVFISAYVGFIYFYLKFSKEEVFATLSVIMLVPSYMVSKWIDIKKYQETWSRYLGLRTSLLQEMVKYLYSQQPYDGMDKNMQFVDRMLTLSKKNIDKFQDNMEKEKGLAVSKWKEMLFSPALTLSVSFLWYMN